MRAAVTRAASRALAASRAIVLALIPLVAVALAGCSTLQPSIAEDPRHELTGVPFFPQTIHQCGPAALATVLGASGVDVSPAELAPLVYIPGRQGSLQVEMLAATRGKGRLAYVLEPEFTAVQAELAAGHPVLVLQDLGALGIRRWHFAAVVGYDPDQDVVILRSGTKRRHLERRSRFLHTWEAGKRWAAVVTPPDQPPATATGAGFIRALAAAERSLPASTIDSAQAVALARWPREPLVLLAGGNQAYASQRFVEAIGHYRALLVEEPENIAGRNNLANALLDAGCPREALAEAIAADAQVQPGSPLEAPVRDTLAKVRSAASATPGLDATTRRSVCAAE